MRNSIRLILQISYVTILLLIFSVSAYAFEKSLDQGLYEIAQKVTKSIPEGAKKAIAVIDFNNLDGNVAMLGRFVSEELITKLFDTERFKVIERSLLDKAIEELKFNTTDLVDPTIAKQVGKVVGADAIVTGTLSDLGQSVKINARVIMIESGEVIGAASVQVIKDASIGDMMKKILKKKSEKDGKEDTLGKKFEFKNKIFEVEASNDPRWKGRPPFKVTLVDIEFIERNRPKVNMTFENLSDENKHYALLDPKKNSYILDETGDVYQFQEVMQMPIHDSYNVRSFKEIVPRVPLKFSVIFKEVTLSSKRITVVVKIVTSTSYATDIIFRDIELPL